MNDSGVLEGDLDNIGDLEQCGGLRKIAATAPVREG